MPFRSHAYDGALSPEDLDFLQNVYEAAAARCANLDDTSIHSAVKQLIYAYQDGERERELLVELTMQELGRAVG